RMAKQMSFTCKPVSAQDALRMGLVNEVVPHDQLLPRAFEIARDICAVNQEILSAMKGLMEMRDDATFDKAKKAERKAFQAFVKKAEALFGVK
ncbi:enoyl-CoA hydratase, partial [archaeon]|nr:enoyl-CoA hydratase [archaeon]